MDSHRSCAQSVLRLHTPAPQARRLRHFVVLLAMALLAVLGCADEQPNRDNVSSNNNAGEEVPMTITITSSAFKANEPIPKKFTADGENVSPPLSWSNLPEGIQQLAMIVDDPDAPKDEPFVHWVLYGMPAGVDGLPENVPAEQRLSEPIQAVQGANDFKEVGYGGPAPPKGHGVHHYHFKLYALDEAATLKPGLSKQQLLDAIEGRVLAQGELIGTYER